MPSTHADTQSLDHPSSFISRHIGPSPEEISAMLGELGHPTLEALTQAAVPAAIRTHRPLTLPKALSEHEALAELKTIALENQVFRSLIGMGYHDTVVPPVIQRNILENPGWYTAYTPYQSEIAQGRLEALLNFQTMVSDLTALPVANASLLDEATAAAEAMALCHAAQKDEGKDVFFAAEDCHPQTIEVLKTRAWPLGWKIVVGPPDSFDFKEAFGALVQYPATDGAVRDYEGFCRKAHEAGALVAVAADLLSLTLLKPPGEFGADIAVGNTQRFGVPLGYGGPHAAYFATKQEYLRLAPGRIVGVSKDAAGQPALRLAIQTREQHIRREKATSNICTAQVLLAVMASMYAVYHGPKGLSAIASRIHLLTAALAAGLRRLGFKVGPAVFFDTVRVFVGPGDAAKIIAQAKARKINLRAFPDGSLGVSFDEKSTAEEAHELLEAFAGRAVDVSTKRLAEEAGDILPKALRRRSAYLSHPVFNRHHSETEMLRYLKRLEAKDLSLTTSMIPLGSCTMKLNASAEMFPVSWPEFAGLHPYAPQDEAKGYEKLFTQLEGWLAELTGFAAVSLQPNAGSQGEYAGLLAIRKYHESRGQARDVCLIPTSAHGTNPASAAMAGLKVVAVACDEEGNIELKDLKAKAKEHAKSLAALMVTYPSTHGVFEAGIKEICAAVHDNGGQVYMDGANLNAQVGLCRPGELGADVCHLNLHKTFCIPHGGGGPGMGPIAVAKHLAPFLPGKGLGPVSAAPWGSASILVITWMYIRMMGPEGLTKATQVAILNANYLAKKLSPHYPVLFKGKSGLVAHECILDLRPLKNASGVTVEDVAKRLMDYGFHAPTVSFPVAGTMMVEPTESESKEELDRFCEAMTLIRREIKAVEEGDKNDNPLKNSPHTALMLASDWKHPYSREQAAFPAPWLKEHKYWPPVARVDNPYGDRNLVCSCPPVEMES